MLDSKKINQAEWIAKHTLTDEQLKQLIWEKFERAVRYYQAVTKREIAQG